MWKEDKSLFRRNFTNYIFLSFAGYNKLLNNKEKSTQVSSDETKLETSEMPQSVISDHPNTQTSDVITTDLLKTIQAQQKQFDSLTGFMKDSGNKHPSRKRHTTRLLCVLLRLRKTRSYFKRRIAMPEVNGTTV